MVPTTWQGCLDFLFPCIHEGILLTLLKLSLVSRRFLVLKCSRYTRYFEMCAPIPRPTPSASRVALTHSCQVVVKTSPIPYSPYLSRVHICSWTNHITGILICFFILLWFCDSLFYVVNSCHHGCKCSIYCCLSSCNTYSSVTNVYFER